MIASANQSWSELEYEQVIATCGLALQLSSISDAERVEAYRLTASAEAALGRDEDAGRAFERLLDLDPTYRFPPTTSPRILAAIEPARARWQVKREQALALELGQRWSALSVDVRLPDRGVGGEPLPIEVSLADPTRIVDRLTLHHRRRGARAYSRMTHRQDGGDRLALPGALTASELPYELELYVEAIHSSGVTLSRAGRADAPLVVEMEAGQVPEPESIAEQWWFWVAIAAVTAAVPVVVTQVIDVGPQEIVARRRP